MLALVAGIGVGAFVVLATRPDPAPPAKWSAWQPTGSEHGPGEADRRSGGQARIASRAGNSSSRRSSSEPKVSSAEGDLPVSTIAIRPDTSTGKKEESEIDIIPTTNSLQYLLCGLGHELLDQGRHGVGGEACAPAARGAGARPLHVQVRRRGRLGLGLPSPAAGRPGDAHLGLPEEERREARSSASRSAPRSGRRRRRSGRCPRGSSHSSIASRSRGSTRTSTSRRRTAVRCSSTLLRSSARSLKNPRLVAAKARLDRLDWWPTPVRIDHVRLFVAPWFFRLPWLSRFDGYAFHRRHPPPLRRRLRRPRHARALPRLAAAASPGAGCR